MRCPKCSHRTRSLYTKAKKGAFMRRRECPLDAGGCGFRFTTEERAVGKVDGPLLFAVSLAGMGPRPKRPFPKSFKPTTEETDNG